MPFKNPKAVLLDLDNTMVSPTVPRIMYWNVVTSKYKESLSSVGFEELSAAIVKRGDWFWGSTGRNMKWRLYLRDARRQIVELAFEDLGLVDKELAHLISDDFSDLREKGENIMALIPGCLDTVYQFKERGVKLALLTNGSSQGQRNKIQRFNLEPLFDQILIEEELGYGKPDPRIYLDAVKKLGVKKENTWMIGDNPLWDVIAPQKVGIKGVWIDLNRKNEPHNFSPFLTIKKLPDILKYLE